MTRLKWWLETECSERWSHFGVMTKSKLVSLGTIYLQLKVVNKMLTDKFKKMVSCPDCIIGFHFISISENPANRKKLELLSQYSLFGNIECLQAVRLAGNTRDSLLMSFKDAKVKY